ncbi:MAG: peptidoglycan-binding protein [Solirubrobacterales bacterium]|nr:peptidoglycan-binding protein [Solirubrobacterales bacterium]
MEARVARCGRRLGDRRLRKVLLIATASAALAVTPALGASGGAGVGGSHRGARHTGVVHTRKGTRAAGNPFSGRGMWIWVLGKSSGGNLGSIVSIAHRYGIKTLMVKSGDGTGMWAQFNHQLVSILHGNGLRVCAWQYVYGNNPGLEAQVGATAVRDGADCLLIDAESEYEGRYVQAQTYVGTLRRLIGASFPVALAGFPYMDYHPGFPYSVFLGPGGAQYDVPQLYWWDIGDPVDTAYAHTYSFNRLYGRPIAPLGQVYDSPPAGQIVRFRQLAIAYGAPGLSWWDWQEAKGGAWRALSQPVGPLATLSARPTVPTIKKGWRGDVVVWAQEHLVSAGYQITIDGGFGPQTQSAVQLFQAAHGLNPDGVLGPATWQVLLRYAAPNIRWSTRRVASAASVSAGAATARPVPKSASLPATRDEIAGAGGAGSPGAG